MVGRRGLPLSSKMRAFADAYAGPGTGAAAARAAGYAGDDATLQPMASRLMKDARVRERIIERVGVEGFAAWMASKPERPLIAEPPPKLPTDPLVKGKGRGTATERIELLMGFARAALRVKRGRAGLLPLDPEMAKVGIASVLAAAELEGERGRTRKSGFDRPLLPPAPTPAPAKNEPKDPAPATPKRLVLVMSPEDRGHG